MIKQLILLFHVFGVFFYQLIFSGDITVNQQLPTSVQAGEEVVVQIIVHKNDVTGFAKVQQEIPQGFEVEAIDTKGATFSFKDNKIKFIWMALPAEEEFTISYKLKADAALTGDFTFGGKFSFISDSERKNIEINKSTITVVKELIVATTTSQEEEETTNSAEEEETTPLTTENTTPEIAVTPVITAPTTIKLLTIKCKRTVLETEPGKFTITIKIEKDGVEGFAKISEEIPLGFIASEENSNEGVFSFKNQKVKILWMAVPKGKEMEISYQLTANQTTENGDYKIKGEFSYLENDATSKYNIDESKISLKIAEPIAVIEPKTKKEEPIIEEEIIEETVPETAPEKEIEEPVTEKKVTSIPSPENGVTYKIQVGAGHKAVSSKYFASKFNLQDKVSTINHEGWIKYLVGNYNEYKEARDKREAVRTNVKTAFVTAYNSGKRITVQEALMISNQKWYK